MALGGITSYKKGIKALLLSIVPIFYEGNSLSFGASLGDGLSNNLDGDNSGGHLVLYLLLFCLLSICLIGWMLWERNHVKQQLARAQEDNNLKLLLLKSRKGVYWTCNKQGGLSSLVDVKKWFGIESNGIDLDCLRTKERAFSDAQFECLVERIERLLSLGINFREQFFLDRPKRYIIVEGDALTEDDDDNGYIIWFMDASVEENIAAFQGQDVKRITSQLDLFKKTNNLIHTPIWMRDENLHLIWVNNAYVDAVDAESAEQVITQGLEIISSVMDKMVQGKAANSRELRESYIEKHFIVIRGERRAVNIHNFPVEYDHDRMGYVGYAQDITALENARVELIHHTESYSETLNKLSTAVAIFTSGKRLEYYNSAFSRLWHLPEELLFSHPHHGELLEAMREARRLPEQANFPQWKAEQLEAYTHLLEPVEEMWHLPDNSSLRVVAQPHPLGGLLIFYEDVTDHFALERSYNTLFAVQRETLNNLHEAVAVFGIDGCLQLYNEAFADIWKLDRDMLDTNPHTMDVMAAFTKNYGESYQIEDLKNLIVGGEEKKILSSGQLKRKDGSVINYAAVPLPDGAMLITFIDVSASFTIEKVLRQRNLALEEADKIKTDFLAHMSYELRTPLNSIIGFSELLEKEYQGPLNHIQHDYMHSILSASSQLLELFNDILDLSVIEAGGLVLDIDQFEIRNLLDQVIESLQERIKVREIDMIVNCADDLQPVCGDIRRIQHTIYNLLSNAVKFTQPYGTITVSAHQDVLNYYIIIQDSGVGIKPEEISKIFEKFFTGSNVQNEQGAGLGLSLVKSFIDLHGGKIDVQSVLNGGTRMMVSLPIKIGTKAQIKLLGE